MGYMDIGRPPEAGEPAGNGGLEESREPPVTGVAWSGTEGSHASGTEGLYPSGTEGSYPSGTEGSYPSGAEGTGGDPVLLWGEPVSADQLAAAERGYARCGLAERLLWERLSVFEGAFGRDAVRAVCASGALPPGKITAVLERLAPLALLAVDDLFDGENDVPRYWMPHPMRAVGARRLTERGDRRPLVLRHRRWCVKLARRAADWWQSGRQLDARDLALRELPDLAAAMDPTTAPLSASDEADTAVEITVSLWFLWVACGRAAEGRTRLRHALSLRTGPPSARALWLAAFLELESGRPEDADPLLVRAWAAAVRDGDDRALGLLAASRSCRAVERAMEHIVTP